MFRCQLKTYFFFEILTICTQRIRDLLIMRYINLHLTLLYILLLGCTPDGEGLKFEAKGQKGGGVFQKRAVSPLATG